MRKKNFMDVNTVALIALAVLKEKQSISETAIYLNISQSAISKLLAELKIEFNDPLYTKVNNEFLFTKIGDSLSSVSKTFLQPGIELIERVKQHKEKEFSIMLPKWVNVSNIRSGLLERFADIDCKFCFRLLDNVDLDLICDSLMNGFTDVCICHFPVYKAGIQKKELCTTELVFLSKNKSNLSREEFKVRSFVKYNISDNLFNSFLSCNNIESLVLSEDVYGVEQWLDFIDGNKIIITTAFHAKGLIAQGYSITPVDFDIKVNYPVHLIWHSRYKYDGFINELCKIIFNSAGK